MSQPQRNLFFFYRGSRPQDDLHDVVYEKQLEDNTTKSLIYVLEHADRKILSGFLRNVVGLRHQRDFQNVQFALQRGDIHRTHLKHRVALAVSPKKGFAHHSKASHQSGRPDAWIWSDNGFAVLIENKTNEQQVTHNQIERHIANADGWNKKNVKLKSIAWEDVYGFFKSWCNPGRKFDSKTVLLIEEFVGYLRMIGLSGTASFEADDFLFFTLRASERTPTHKSLVQRKLVLFTKELSKTSVARKIFGLYGLPRSHAQLSPGVFRGSSNNFWITLGPKERRNYCHLNVRISESGIGLEAFSPHKSFTKKLIHAIQSDPKKFLASIRSIPKHDPYRIRLREAHYANPGSSYKGQHIGSSLDYLEVHPSILNAGNIQPLLIEPVLKRLRRSTLRPEVFLVRDFGLSELMGNTNTVKVVADVAENMLPFVKFALDVTRRG